MMTGYGDLQILSSAAGWYIGRLYYDGGIEYPGTRESHYYSFAEDAESAFNDGFVLRVCDENLMAYNRGDIDTFPGTFWKNGMKKNEF